MRSSAAGRGRTMTTYDSGSQTGRRTRTRVWFYAVPPPEKKNEPIGGQMPPFRFATARLARQFVDKQGNSWHVEQRREPITQEPEQPPDEES